MANKRWSDVHPCKDEKDGNKRVTQPSSKSTPAGGADCKQHPHHTGPKVVGPGEVPKA